jgi:type IV pilus assembly protein PilW
MTRMPRKCPASARGYTLMELIIAVGLGVAIMLALLLLFSQNSGNQQELERTVRQVENARYSVDTLAEDVMHAGFFSGFNPNTLLTAPTYTTPDPCDIRVRKVNAADPAPQGWDSSADPVQIPLPVEGIPATRVVDCLANRRADTEAIVIRRSETGGTIDWGAGRSDNLYIQAARCESDPAALRVSSVPASEPEKTFDLRLPDCATANNALRRLLQRTYYVATCNDCVTNDGGNPIPTLKRVEMIDGALLTTSIAEGVENLQFEYGVDTSGDGVPDTTLTAGAVAAADWPNVVSVRMHVLTRSTQPSPGHVETRTYQLGPSVAVAPASPPDGFKRTLLSSTVRLNNVGGRRE